MVTTVSSTSTSAATPGNTAQTPSVWLGCMSHYNAGYLVGDWYDAAEASTVTVAELHRGTGLSPAGCEELWCYDTEYMLVDREMSPHEAQQQAEALFAVDEHLRPALRAWVASGDYVAEGDGRSDVPALGDFHDRYCGNWDSFEEYAADLVDSTGMLQGVPEEVAQHFDWKSHARELVHDYAVLDAQAPASGVYVFRSC